MTDALARSLELFHDLGWADAAHADALELPLGSEAEQREAHAGLRRGDWSRWVTEGNRAFSQSLVGGADHGMLALFAIRVGADARRTEAVLGGSGSIADELAADVLATRGPEFAASFITRACRSNRRVWEHSTSVHAGRAVRLVHRHELEVPGSVEYLKDWAVYAALALGLEAELFPSDRGAIDPEVIRSRFGDHVRTGIAVGAPATGPFGGVVAGGVERGWISRDEAVPLALAALDAAQRPGDRKVWAGVLTDGLGFGDDEIVTHADALLGALSHAEAPVVTAFAPAIVEHGDEHQAADVLALSLTVGAKAARRLVLDAGLRRVQPLTGESAETASLALAAVANGRDATLARAAQTLQERWGATVEPVDGGVSAQTEVAWQPTPDPWSVPRFELPAPTPAGLTEAAGVLASRPEGAEDLAVDRFLELANAIAAADPGAARSALRGLRPNWRAGASAAADWVAGDPIRLLDRLVGPGDADWRQDTLYRPFTAREASVVQRLGEVPMLLSTPSWVDLRIDPDDLVERLRAYVAAGATASEADLLLALLRLDLSLVEPHHLDALAALDVPVVLQSGAPMTVAAGPAARDYARDPLREPAVVRDEDGDWVRAEVELPSSLAAFPKRLDTSRYGWGDPAELPSWNDGAFSGDGLDAGSGVVWHQLARRGAALGPLMAARMLGGLRSPHPKAATEMFAAVLEAWDRGLLRPGVADLGMADRGGHTGAAAFARVALELADAGLGSLVWPILDDYVGAALDAVRMIAGTAEIVETIGALLPAARAAVAAGVAEPSVLDLPHTRALAARPGSSRAVAAAQAVVAQLPEPTTPPAAAVDSAAPAVDLDAVWPIGDGAGTAVDDAVELTASLHTRGSKRFVPIEFALPAQPEVRYRALMAWSYALDHEGQLDADTIDGDERRWLQWDASLSRIVPSEFRDRSTGGNGPASRDAVPPLTVLMVAVVLASLCSDVESRYSVDAMVASRRFSADSVRLATARLLPLPDIAPARMMGAIERDVRAIPVLWPLLTESVRYAASLTKPPAWLNRVLDVALLRAPLLRAASAAGRIPAEDATWHGLAELAAQKGSSAALTKARRLVTELGLG